MGSKRDISTPKHSVSSDFNQGSQVSGLLVSPIRSDRDRANLIRKILGLRMEMNENTGAVSGKLGELYISHAATIASVNFQNDFVETINSKMNELSERERIRDQKIEEMAFEVMETKASLRSVHKETRENTLELKSKNLVINGIPETKDENAITTVVKFLKNIDPNFSAEKLENAYRLGQAGGKGTRSMLVKFKDPIAKQNIMRKKSALKSKKECDKIYCNDDLPDETRKHRQKLRIIAKHANSIGYQNTCVRGNGLWHEGKLYRENELTLLPEYLRMESIRTRDIGHGHGIGFFGKESFLSNHHPARISMNEHRFLNSEQAFFYYKSVVCGQEITGQEIKKMMDPSEIKKLGEKIPTCDEWEQKKLKVMKSILVRKFEQNKDLREKLINTGTKPLLECTTDLFWGTGRVIYSQNWNDCTEYPGQNNLGKILESIRENYLPVTALFDPATFPSGKTKGANYTSTPMPNPTLKSSKRRRMPSHGPKPPAKQMAVDLAALSLPTQSAVVDAVNSNKSSVPSAGPIVGKIDSSTSISTVISSQASDNPEKQVPTYGEEVTSSELNPSTKPLDGEKERLTKSQVMEIDELTFSDTLYQSYDAKNVTNRDGSLNIEKIQSWGLPALNTSRLMEVTGYGTDDAREKLSRLLSAQNAGESYIEKDPSKATPVDTVTRKTLEASRQARPTSEKEKLYELLENV